MFKWILQDLKRSLLSRKSYILMIIVIASIFGQFYLHNQSNRHFDPDGNEIFLEATADDYAVALAEGQIWNLYNQTINNTSGTCAFGSGYDPQMYPDNVVDEEKCPLLAWFDQNYAKYISINPDIEKIPADQAVDFYNYLIDKRTDPYFDNYDKQVPAMQEVIREKSLNFDQVKAIKERIKANNDFEDYEEFKILEQPLSISDFNALSESLIEVDYIVSNNLPLNVTYQLTASFFIAKYINNFFLLLLVVGVLVIFDSFYRDYKSGVIKNILSSPIKRSRYLFMKTVSSFLSIFTIVALPVLLTALGLYIYLGYDSINYPIYISKSSLNSLKPTREYAPVINAYFPTTHFSSFKNICKIGPVSSTTVDLASAGFGETPRCGLDALTVTSITLKQFIVHLMAYYLLLMTFIASLNSLMSMIIKKELYNLIAMLTIIALSGLIANFFIGASLLKLLPFTFINPTRLIMGTLPYTFFNGVVTLSLWTLGLIICNFILIKKTDFAY